MPISECPYVSDSDSILYDPLPSKASGNAVMTVATRLHIATRSKKHSDHLVTLLFFLWNLIS